MEISESFENSLDYTPIFELSLNDIYLIALNFFKENKDKAFHMNYQNKIKMTSLSYHIRHGPYENKSMPDIGMLDVVGKDIRRQWQSLGNANKEKSQQEFIDFLKLCCPEFTGFLEAKYKQAEIETYEKHQRLKIEEERLRQENEKIAQDKAFKRALQAENQKRVDEENKLRSILNQQTLPQFHEYAIQQHPDDIKAQEKLIAQLQQHHFHQYMLAIYERNRTESESNGQEAGDSKCQQVENGSEQYLDEDILTENGIRENGEVKNPNENPSYNSDMVEIWFQASIDEFKASFATEPDSVMKIGSGEVVTIRVPCSASNNFLVWQFATDECDIGFGISVSQEGDASQAKNTELVPVLRRDSHKQVYCGRLKLLKGHNETDQPFFLLRFDNSYSLWRHKWLYYRVCYSD